MPVEVYQDKNVIRFTLSGLLYRRVLDWIFSQDEIFFNEQLTTGSFHGRYVIDDTIRSIMQSARNEGRILPWYGEGGGRSAGVFMFQQTESSVVVRVEHPAFEGTVEFADQPGTAPEPNIELRFRIEDKLLSNLRQWDNWIEADASTVRYIYRFVPVSIGVFGYTVRVTDTLTGTTVDISDYEDW